MMRLFLLFTLLGSAHGVVDVLRIAINSPNEHRWLANSLPGDGCVIHFKAKGSRDLAVTFSPEKSYVQDIYQVVIGADNNQNVCIRKEKGTQCQVENSFPGIVSGNLQDIWVAFKPSMSYLFIGVWKLIEGKIQQLAVYNDPSPLSPDDWYIGVTSFVATSTWLFTLNEACDITEVEEVDQETNNGGDSPGSGQANEPSNIKVNPVGVQAGNSRDNQVNPQRVTDDGPGKSGSNGGGATVDKSGYNQGETGRGLEDDSSGNTANRGSTPNDGVGNDSSGRASDSTSEFFKYEFSEDGDASWQFIPSAIKRTPIFLPFALKRSGDAYLRLSSDRSEDNANYYEIMIGSSGSKVVRANNVEMKEQQFDKDVLSDDGFVNYIVKLHGSSLLLYKEGVPVIQYVDDKPLEGLRFIGVNSYTSSGEVQSSWQFLRRFFED